MEKTFPYIVINVQSISDVITNSSSEVVTKMNRNTVDDIKEVVNSLLEKFTELKFDDLFTVQYVVNDDNDIINDILYLDEDDPRVDEYIERDENDYDSYPCLSQIKVSSKPGRDLDEAALLLSKLSDIFNTEVYYG